MPAGLDTDRNMSPKQALAERERLLDEREAAQQAKDEAGAEGRRLDAAIKTLRADRREALQAAARGGEAVDADGFDRREAEMTRDRERAGERVEQSKLAAQTASQERERLHVDQFAPLAENAEELTTVAMQKLEALEKPFREAHSAWMAARREWNVLAKYNDLDPVPHAPMAEPGIVFNYPPPRPPGVRPESEPEPEADPEPETGTVRVFEHVDGRRKTTKQGDMLCRELAKNEEWREVEAA